MGTVLALYLVWTLTISTHDALCALKQADERALSQSQDFLAENPNGVPGISRAVLLRSIANREEELDALSHLDCE